MHPERSREVPRGSDKAREVPRASEMLREVLISSKRFRDAPRKPVKLREASTGSEMPLSESAGDDLQRVLKGAGRVAAVSWLIKISGDLGTFSTEV